jgi:hypothetical protein
MPDGSRFGDPTWDFNIIARMSQRSKKLHIAQTPGLYGETARHLLMAQCRPTHPTVIESGIIVSATPVPFGTLIDAHYRLRTMAAWGTARDLNSFAEWTQADLNDLLDDLRSGNHKPDGEALGSTTVRQFITIIKLLYKYAPVLPNSFTSEPWPRRSAAKIAKEVINRENETPPLDWDTWRPLVSAACVFVNKFSTDIIRADKALRDAPTSSQLNRGLTGTAAIDRRLRPREWCGFSLLSVASST